MNQPILKYEIPGGTEPVQCRSCSDAIYVIPHPIEKKRHAVNEDGTRHFCTEAGKWRRVENERREA